MREMRSQRDLVVESSPATSFYKEIIFISYSKSILGWKLSSQEHLKIHHLTQQQNIILVNYKLYIKIFMTHHLEIASPRSHSS